MDYKRAYKEALERARLLHGASADAEIEEIFPELKESEDEKISKAILAWLKNDFGESQETVLTPRTNEIERWYKWLEKQKKKKPTVIIPKFRAGDTIRLKGSSSAEHTIESISDGSYHGKGWVLNFDADDSYELVEKKPEWSEEDKRMLEHLVGWLKGSYGILPGVREKFIDWLESLRPQSRWKPTEEQVNALYDVLNPVDAVNKQVLESLYNDLKKL